MKSEGSLRVAFDRAVANVIRYGTTDVDLIGRPFEAEFLKDKSFSNQLRQEIVGSILTGEFDKLEVGTVSHLLVPKKTLADFRSCAFVDIRDELVYLTLVLSIARAIEEKRIRRSQQTVFSYRLKHDDHSGGLFDPNYSYRSFGDRVASNKKLAKYNVMVSCDIASFYDRLNLHRLNSTLLSIPKADRDIVGLIDELLLFWSGRNSYGLPVGSNASRILAEAELIEVDNYLWRKGVEFCRFVDDYRIFAVDASEASKHLQHLVFALEREGLFLNSGKTKIEDISADVKSSDDAVSETKRDVPKRDFRKNVLVIPGYSGLIPLKYRVPASSEAEKLMEFDIDASLAKAAASITLDSFQFRDLMKAISVQEEWSALRAVLPLVDKCPQFTPYVVDYCIKHGAKLGDEEVAEIAEYFAPRIRDNETPEYQRIAISRLFSSDVFERIDVLTECFLGLQRNSGGCIGRILLDCLSGRTNRLQTLEIRDHGTTTNINELRSLCRVVAQGLPASESAPFLKNMRIRYSDLLLRRTIKNS